MITIGLDIGTTTISAVAAQSQCGVVDAITVSNGTFIPGPHSWEKIQQPELIWEKVIDCLRQLLERHPDCGGIGVTGQQHGILYLDAAGACVSPLYTWQDGRSALPESGGLTYAETLAAQSGYAVPVGYGMATHDYNLKNGLVPQNASVFCTIQDFVAMRLSGRTAPLIDASDAASFGLFDLKSSSFDASAAARAGISADIFPAVSRPAVLGAGHTGLPVCTAIGDNQASFIGATQGAKDCMLINIGTGSQISIHSSEMHSCPGLELRPFPQGGSLTVGASICGGRAYAMLERFFSRTLEMVTGKSVSCYDAMAALASEEVPEDPPVFVTTFQGTRADPEKRGSISGLTEQNFTPRDFIYGMLNGTVQELYEMYCRYTASGAPTPKALYGSGNGLRKNALLRKLLEDRFEIPLQLSANEEEAAYGAALYAAQILEM